MAARSASVIVRVGERGGCSATKVAPNLLLSAAHCIVGFTGEEDLGAPRFERDGTSHDLAVAQIGAFEPAEGKVADWVLLAPLPGDDPFAGIPTATLATAAELGAMTDALSDRIDDKTHPVWALTFPAPSRRAWPRTPMPGGPFSSRGFLKSPAAYRQATAAAIAGYFIFDDRAPGDPPAIPSDWEAVWDGESAEALRGHYDRYEAAGMPILHHSADYAPGSSGGGVFSEATGNLLGIIPFGASIVSRRDAYPGFGQLYRVDAICADADGLEC